MRAVFSLVLVVGIGLAGFAVYMAKGYISDYQNALAAERAARTPAIETTEVFVITEPLRYGEQLTKENIRVVKWPSDAIPEGTFNSLEELFPADLPSYRTVLRAMEKNEAVLAVKVTEPGVDAGVASRLSAGMRAFAIRVDVSSGVSGFISPGDRVDVYWTGRAAMNNDGAREVTKLIQQNVKIIAIDQSADLDRNAPTVARTVTVEVTPEQVAALAQAQATGQMTLSLVGQGDTTEIEGVEVDQNALLGIEDYVAPPPPEPEPEICTVRTRKGSEIVETPIPCPTN
ncbi:MAG: Flp pilus assembly protein CpaB [Maritimibacter sp.]|jgi:pilus assembly protein CpaB